MFKSSTEKNETRVAELRKKKVKNESIDRLLIRNGMVVFAD